MPFVQRDYPFAKSTVLNALYDMAELQRAPVTHADISAGVVVFCVELYGVAHPRRFTVAETPTGCAVRLDMDQNGLRWRAFALLESLLALPPKGGGGA